MPRRNISYEEALRRLYGLQRFGIKLGLENAQRLMTVLDFDLRHIKVVHVAGTNGKGSVCAMVDSICRAAGYRTGLFTSPHLVTFRERIRVDGRMIPPETVAAGVAHLLDRVADWDPHPTFFEVVTALALQHFVAERCAVIVLETGLGGRLDATNAVPTDVSVITPIGLDHQQFLGESLRQIAVEKAGIIRSKVPVIAAPQLPDAAEVLRARATECEAPLTIVTKSYSASAISLDGEHQKQNAAVALAALHAAAIEVTPASIVHGLASVEWPARFQRWDERTIIDGAHNPASAMVLAQTWRELFGDQRATIVLAVLADKDARAICEILAPIAELFLLPKIRSDRALSPEALAQTLSRVTPGSPSVITPSVAAALTTARERLAPILITGSLHFAGETLACLRGESGAFEECGQ